MDLFWFGVQLFLVFAILLPLAIVCVVAIWVTAPWLFWVIGGGIVFALASS